MHVWEDNMNDAQLIEKLSKGEGFHTEFKKTLPSKENLAKEIVCFANTNGGQIFIGVDDSGNVTGLGSIDQAMLLIEDVAYSPSSRSRPNDKSCSLCQ